MNDRSGCSKRICVEGRLAICNFGCNNKSFDKLEIVTTTPLEGCYVHTIAGLILEVADNIGIDQEKRVRLIFEEIN